MTESRPMLDYAAPVWEETRPWWHGSVWDWLGSFAFVVLALTVLVLAFVGLAYVWLSAGR